MTIDEMIWQAGIIRKRLNDIVEELKSGDISLSTYDEVRGQYNEDAAELLFGLVERLSAGEWIEQPKDEN